MTAPAINTVLPASTTAGANAASPPGASAAAGFEALLGALFGDQKGLAAQLFAGAKPGETTEPAEDSTDPTAAVQSLAGAFLTLPLAPSTPTTTATGDAAEPAAPAIGATAGGIPAPGAASTTLEATSSAGDAATDLIAKSATGDAASAADLKVQAATVGPAPGAPAQQPVKPQAVPVVEAAAIDATVQAAAAADAAETPPPAAQATTQAVAAAPPPPAVKDKAAQASARHAEATTEVDAAVSTAPRAIAAAPASGTSADGGASANLAKGAKTETFELPNGKTPADGGDHRAQNAPLPATPLPVAAPITHAAAPVRVVSETVAHMAAQVASQLQGGSTHFDFELTPAGLGRVDVRVEISAHGQLTAAMSFDNPNAAAELRHRSSELSRALEQAGFDLSGGLSFDVAGDRGQAGQGAPQQRDDSGEAWRGRAFQAALDVAGETDAVAAIGAFNAQRRSATGVDIRI